MESTYLANRETVSRFLMGSMNLLIVEDEAIILSTLADIFSSPFFNIYKASSIAEAEKTIGLCRGKWHCWIIDLSIDGKQDAGLALIEAHGPFAFAVIYSGMRSMESAANAIKKGAVAVIDKGGSGTLKLVKEVCALAPLALLCRGKLCKDKEILFLLKDKSIKGPKEWAENACVSLRQLENISELQTKMPPSFAIPLYYGLRHLLLSDLTVNSKPSKKEDFEFCVNCLNFIHNNLSLYRNVL
jgi:hypothetical protein